MKTNKQNEDSIRITAYATASIIVLMIMYAIVYALYQWKK